MTQNTDRRMPTFKTLAAGIALALSLASGSSFAQHAYPTPDAAAQAFARSWEEKKEGPLA